MRAMGCGVDGRRMRAVEKEETREGERVKEGEREREGEKAREKR